MTTEKKIEIFIGYPIIAVLGALLMKWYNHIWFSKQLGFWWLLVLGIIFLYAANVALKWIKPFVALLFVFALVAQVLAWANVLTLPLIK